MATVQDIIYLAFEALGVYRPGETPSATVRDRAFTTLQQMMTGWSAEEVMSIVIAHGSFNVTAGTRAYTFGVGGALSTSLRPIRVTSWRSESGQFSNGGRIISFAELQEKFVNPTGRTSVVAEMVAADQNFPLIGIHVAPTPAASPGTLFLDYTTPLPVYATVGDTVVLPDGYEQALVYNLAIALAPAYAREKGVPPELAAMAQNSKAAIVEKNAAILGLGQKAAA